MILTITILTPFFMFIYIYILVRECEGLSEQLNLQSKSFLDLLILREDLSPSQLSVIQTEQQYHAYYVLLLFIIQ